MQWKLNEICIFTRHANTQYPVHIERNQKKDYENNNNGKLGKFKFSIRFTPEKGIWNVSNLNDSTTFNVHVTCHWAESKGKKNK